jgi:hypothetical protein
LRCNKHMLLSSYTLFCIFSFFYCLRVTFWKVFPNLPSNSLILCSSGSDCWLNLFITLFILIFRLFFFCISFQNFEILLQICCITFLGSRLNIQYLNLNGFWSKNKKPELHS